VNLVFFPLVSLLNGWKSYTLPISGLLCISVVQDAVLLYLINSPVERAEPLRFKKEGVYGVVSIIYLLLYYIFCVGDLFIDLGSVELILVPM
jgi:hypothetical protein